MTLLPDYTFSAERGLASQEFVNANSPSGSVSWLGQYHCGTPNNNATHGSRVYGIDDIWVPDSIRKRHGNYSYRCRFFGAPDGYGAFNCTSTGSYVAQQMGPSLGVPMQEGDEEWVGWSWFFPTDMNTARGGVIWEWGSGTVNFHPRYGGGWGYNGTTLRMHHKYGRTANPGGETGFDYNGTYHADETWLGTGGPVPFTKGIWLDCYYHIIYRARTNGVMEFWYREEDQAFKKLYSNKNDGTALINRPPHPTHYYNALYGTPGEGSTTDNPGSLFYRMYTDASPSSLGYIEYWADGMFRRPNEQAILNEFSTGTVTFPVPTITSFNPTNGPAGTTSVVITGTNFTGVTIVTFNVVSASFNVNSSTQITATVPSSATSGPIEITNQYGTGVSTSNFTVASTPAPVLPNPASGHLRVGNSTVGIYSNSGVVVDTKRVIKRNVGVGNTIRIDKAYFLSAGPISGGTGLAKLIVYDDDGITALPGTLVGVAPQKSLTQGLAATWIPIDPTPIDFVAGSTGDIYFGIHFGGPGNINYNYQSAASQGWRLSDTYSDGPSDPFGTSPVVVGIEPAIVIDYIIISDSTAPIFQDATINAESLLIIFDEVLDPTSIPSPGDFVVTINGFAVTVIDVELIGTNVRLTLITGAEAGDTVTVAYTVPASGKLRDVAGNNCISLTAQPVNNLSAPLVGQRFPASSHRVTSRSRTGTGTRRTGQGGGGG